MIPVTSPGLINVARTDPTTFLHFLLTATGVVAPRDPPARVHRDLQEFLTQNRMALVELPRDHGKTTQVCGRILWELGQNPEPRASMNKATRSPSERATRKLGLRYSGVGGSGTGGTGRRFR